jgi:hypothetical protein
MAMDLRRRNEECVVKPMVQMACGEARQEAAGARGDRGVDWVDSVGEAGDDSLSQLR